MLIDACLHGYWDVWKRNGADATLQSYAAQGMDVDCDLGWFQSLPLVWQNEEYIVCHAGLTLPKLSDNSPDDLLWGREWLFSSDSRPREKQVIFGHTPNKKGVFRTNTGDIGIDGGCVFGGKLCAVEISGGTLTKYEINK